MTIDENYDLWAACNENNVKHDDIDAVLLELTGENDEQEWHWLVSIIGGGFAYISGWCDYTGWDCQSVAERFDANSLESALALCPQDVRRVFFSQFFDMLDLSWAESHNQPGCGLKDKTVTTI